MKKIAVLLMFVMVLSIGCGGDSGSSGASNEPEMIALTVGMDSQVDTVTYIYADKFGQVLSDLTGGMITVEIHPNATLGSDQEMVNSVRDGSLDIVVQTTAPEVDFMPKLAVFDMPNVFPSAEIGRKALDNPTFFSVVEQIYAEAGFKILGFADQGFRTMSSNVMVNSVGDIAGVKIRTMPNPYHLAYWESLGANPAPMAFSELYIGLQQGTVDAQENPYEVIVANKLYEQQDYVINTNHIFHIIAMVMNPARFNSLSPENQQVVMEAVNQAKIFARQQADARVADRVSIMEEAGTEIIDLPVQELAAMAERAEPVYTRIRQDVGDELVDALLTAVREVEN